MEPIQFNKAKPMDLIAMGRINVDLYANEVNRAMEETVTFTKSIGGSPANIAVGIARLGMDTGFIGRVSDDPFGRYLINAFMKEKIDISNIKVDTTGAMNSIAFTEVKSPRNCNVILYRDHVADLNISPLDIREDYISKAKVLLVSGTALSRSPSREAVLLAIKYARKHQVAVFLDLDYRAYTWTSPEETSIYYKLAAEKCDVILGTREEFDVMESTPPQSTSNDLKTAMGWFEYEAKLVVIKHGKEGSAVYTKDGKVFHSNVLPAKVRKTFGAGDAYASAFIYGLLQAWPIEQCLEWGSASAAIVISRTACAESMPTVKEIEEYIIAVNNGEIIEE